jgi:parallel beta-helix repeat protein
MKSSFALAVIALCCVFAVPRILIAQGSLTPPGPPAPTMKSLDQVQPRTPISSLPITITNSGSYYLAGNLTGQSGTNGITIACSQVTLDLAGFTLAGVPGAMVGVNIPNGTNIVVVNGTIRGWGNLGIFANVSNGRFEHLNFSDDGTALQSGTECLVLACTAYNNLNGFFVGENSTVKDCAAGSTGPGITTGDACVVDNCTVTGSGFLGFSIGNGCTVKGCAAKANFPAGFKAGDGCTLIACTAFNNGATGMVARTDCTIKDCTAKSNGSVGIRVENGSSVTGCTSSQNGGDGFETTLSRLSGCIAFVNSRAGISSSASSITDCTVYNNTLDGILVDSDSQVLNNDISGNGSLGATAGLHVTGSNNRIDGNHSVLNSPRNIWVLTTNGNNTIIRNTAGVDLFAGGTNYVIAPGNDLGPVGGATNSTSPWANIAH